MFGIDLWSLKSFLPSIAIVITMLVLVGVGIRTLKRFIREDAIKAGEQG
ncbi:hypothetical protein [Balneatrix alpica]|uniref:NADH dehydrogenase subunit 1 n=1 Tax=Balneatrix alpica TaxID=75684 RepID=A0ABV5Z7X8_9GAMM|nr:hypothetical protein [Balneatrix alpica]